MIDGYAWKKKKNNFTEGWYVKALFLYFPIFSIVYFYK